jgi:hypothetical protein
LFLGQPTTNCHSGALLSASLESITPVAALGPEQQHKAHGFQACAKWRIPE